MMLMHIYSNRSKQWVEKHLNVKHRKLKTQHVFHNEGGQPPEKQSKGSGNFFISFYLKMKTGYIQFIMMWQAKKSKEMC